MPGYSRTVTDPHLVVSNQSAASAKKGSAKKGSANKKKKLSFLEQLLADPTHASTSAAAFMNGRYFVSAGVALGVPLREFDTWLVLHDNSASPGEATKAIEGLSNTSIASLVRLPAWQRAKQDLLDSLIATLLTSTEPAVRGGLTRLLLVAGLVDDLAIVPATLTTPDDVENALRYRTLVLPQDLLQLIPRKSRLARRYGFADLYVVRDEWNRYEAGEIAHIENVLPYESKKRSLRTLSETEVTTSVETETTDTEEYDSQTTDRMELQQHAQSETDLAVHMAAQVDVQASYGAMQISANVGGSFDYSQKNAQDHAYQQSHESVTRAVKRVEQRVKTSRTTRSLQRTTEDDKHALVNASGQNVVGIYRWVDKVQRLQLFRYPHRLLLEFEIPEPAAYLTWRRSQPRGDFLTPEPIPLIKRQRDFSPWIDTNKKTVPLTPVDIDELTYERWVGAYQVQGVTQPPPQEIQVTARLELKDQVPASAGAGGGGGGGGGANADSATPSITDRSIYDLIAPGDSTAPQPGITIPDGYRLESWKASAYSSDTKVVFDSPGYAQFKPGINVMVGNQNVPLQRTQWDSIDTQVKHNLLGPGNPPNPPTPVPDVAGYVFTGGVTANLYASPAPPVTGVLQITAHLGAVKECVVHVTLQCVRTAAGLWPWQQQTYEQIAAAYWALKRQRADEQAAQSTGSGVEIKGDSPERNKEVIIEELKRGVIEMLTGSNFKGRDAMQSVPDGQPPLVNLDLAITVAEEIQFIEQAFEWENLTYVLYPYFWAKYERWPQLADVTGTDPDFDRFVRSGSARVVVPARPKFENEVCAYVDFGVLWGGGPVPTVNDPDYLSVAAEIMAQQSPPEDGEKLTSWEVRLPTTLVWLDYDNTLPKSNPHPTLDAPPGQTGNTAVTPAPGP